MKNILFKKSKYLNIAFACVGDKCHESCKKALKLVSYHIDTVLSDDNASSSISLLLYKRIGAKKIVNDLKIYDAIFFVADVNDEESVNRCLEASEQLEKESACSCIFLSENKRQIESSLSVAVIKESELCHTIARLFSACNLSDALERELSLVLDLSEKCTSIFKWELLLKSLGSGWEKRLDNIDLDGATQVLAVIKSKESLSLEAYDELSFALMSRLGDGIDISFETIQDEKLKGTAMLSIYSGYPKKVLELDRTNFTKN
ncbi:MAG: hypothetical protein IJ400_05745 [Clostridia bacterium]|nr:hypothetical protein [Clostridia bacterium]